VTKVGAVIPNSLCGNQLEGDRNDTQLMLSIVVSGIASLPAEAVVRRISVGLIGTIVVGILGAFIGGWIFGILHNNLVALKFAM